MESLPPAPHDGHEVGPLQDVEMLCRRLARHAESLTQLAQRLAIVLAQTVEQESPGGVGQRLEDQVDRPSLGFTPPLCRYLPHNVNWRSCAGLTSIHALAGGRGRAALVDPAAGDTAAGVLSWGDRVSAAGAGLGGRTGRVGLRAGRGVADGAEADRAGIGHREACPPGQKWSRWAWVIRSPIGTRRPRSATVTCSSPVHPVTHMVNNGAAPSKSLPFSMLTWRAARRPGSRRPARRLIDTSSTKLRATLYLVAYYGRRSK